MRVAKTRIIPLLVRRDACAPLHYLRLRAIALALRVKVASQHLIDVASTPPHEEGNSCRACSAFARKGIICFIALILCSAAAFAQDPPAGVLADIGIDQKLNAQIPMDLMFRDEAGRDVRIGNYFDHKPVILSLVYYECPMLCSMTLNGLVKSLRPLSFTVGNEFEVVTVSFDPSEKPDLAAAKKSGYMKDYGRPGAGSGWHFLTGSADSIRRLTDAAGYRYKWDEYTKQWAHVSAILILTPDGRVSQYLYGIEFSAKDVRLSLVQASQNKIGTIIDRALLYCYHYNPDTGKYGLVIMNAVRLAGLATVAALALFIAINIRRETA
jgi:protein SCO1